VRRYEPGFSERRLESRPWKRTRLRPLLPLTVTLAGTRRTRPPRNLRAKVSLTVASSESLKRIVVLRALRVTRGRLRSARMRFRTLRPATVGGTFRGVTEMLLVTEAFSPRKSVTVKVAVFVPALE
jgi:hypothetical protein